VCTSTYTADPSNAEAVLRTIRKKDFLLKALHEHGCALTSTREALVDILSEINGHICAQHLAEMAKARYPQLRLNKTTVYRNLDTLVQLGLLAEMKDADGRAQYEFVPFGHAGHLRCVRCGKVEHLDEESVASLKNRIFQTYGFVPDFQSYPISGLCKSCQQGSSSLIHGTND
jgi:Fe2+ or Zn2+ uptake regulation protein